ncbi:MAG: FAD-binding oxidoreductase, partial [Candidatus Limnocylindria bacterium]
MPEPLAWQIATVTAIRTETRGVNSFTLELPAWRPHRAGQHYDIRLTAADGYQAQRSYSIASPPSHEGAVDLTIERIADGEV